MQQTLVGLWSYSTWSFQVLRLQMLSSSLSYHSQHPSRSGTSTTILVTTGSQLTLSCIILPWVVWRTTSLFKAPQFYVPKMSRKRLFLLVTVVLFNLKLFHSSLVNSCTTLHRFSHFDWSACPGVLIQSHFDINWRRPGTSLKSAWYNPNF